MRPYFLGRVTYFFGYPILRAMLKDSTRAYVIILVNNEVLVTKNWLGWQQKWRLPGGGVHESEQPIIAAQRELKEEIGLAIHEQNLEPVGTESFASSFKYQYFLFVLRLPQKPELKVDGREILSAEFVPIHTLASMNISEEVDNFLRLAK